MVGEDWGKRSREGVLLVLGAGMLVAATGNWIVTGLPPDKVVVGAALAILGIIPVLQNGGGK